MGARSSGSSKQVGVRLDEAMQADLDEIRQHFGFKNNSDAIRGLITIFKTKEILLAEIEGRLLEKFTPILEARLKDYYATDEFKELIRSIMDEVIKDEEAN